MEVAKCIAPCVEVHFHAISEALAVIEEAFQELGDDDGQEYRQSKGSFHVLEHSLVVLQNLLFDESTKLDFEIKLTIASRIITDHNNDVAMQEKLKLSIVMKEQIGNKLTKTSDHEIALMSLSLWEQPAMQSL